MRIAIVSSPRSGNTWLRCILRDGLGLEEIAVHNYLDVSSIPERCIFQLHWYREPNFQHFLATHAFQVITLARRPLDVLISVLHFIQYEPDTAKWLASNCELPKQLVGRSPSSDEFLEYALSFGAENLLSVTYQWWHEPSAIKIRYEKLVAAAALEANKIAERLALSAERLADAVATHSLESFKALPNRHGWQGRPDLWRELISFEDAAAIYARHEQVFRTLGYTVEPSDLTRDAAESNWAALQ